MCRGLREREESGWFVRELLLAKSPALQNICHFWAFPILCLLWFCTRLLPHFGPVFSLSSSASPFVYRKCPSWFISLFAAPDFLYFFLLTRKNHFSYLSAHNWQWESLALTFILVASRICLFICYFVKYLKCSCFFTLPWLPLLTSPFKKIGFTTLLFRQDKVVIFWFTIFLYYSLLCENQCSSQVVGKAWKGCLPAQGHLSGPCGHHCVSSSLSGHRPEPVLSITVLCCRPGCVAGCDEAF